jgi:PD-(D/E)XK nuclease superfamily
VRHSDFLAYLLDPRSNHGLRDAFVKRLLQKALTFNDTSLSVSPIELDLWDLGLARVLREEHRIDVLLLDDAHELAVIIENKIDGKEHGGQLRRYREAVLRDHPDWNIICLYLTPEGDDPSDENYLPIDYGLIHKVVEDLAETRVSVLGANVRTLMIHYAQMLRRHIVSESEMADLCRRIYRKHQRALDLIYEHRPDRQAELHEFLVGLIGEHPELTLDESSKRWVRFFPQAWDKETLRVEKEWVEPWTSTRRMLLFQFDNLPDKINLQLVVGPGPEEARQRLLDTALRNGSPFNPRNKTLNNKWNLLFRKNVVRLSEGAQEEDDEEEIKQEIRRAWERFLEEDLHKIDEAIKAESWLWDSPEESEGSSG